VTKPERPFDVGCPYCGAEARKDSCLTRTGYLVKPNMQGQRVHKQRKLAWMATLVELEMDCNCKGHQHTPGTRGICLVCGCGEG